MSPENSAWSQQAWAIITLLFLLIARSGDAPAGGQCFRGQLNADMNESSRVHFHPFPWAGQWAGAVGRGEERWSVAGADEADKSRVQLPCDPAWGPGRRPLTPPLPQPGLSWPSLPAPFPSQWGGRQTRPADLEANLQLPGKVPPPSPSAPPRALRHPAARCSTPAQAHLLPGLWSSGQPLSSIL